MMEQTKLSGYVEERQEELIDFLKSLIRIDSTNPGAGKTGKKEAEIQHYLKNYLEEAGFEVTMFSEASEEERYNIIATLPGKTRDPNKSIIFCCHQDTVPVSEPEKWKVDPFGGEEIEGRIYGRGANDMKGGTAAAIFAAKAVKELGVEHDGDIILMLTCGEESCEGPTIGAAACARRGYKAPLAIVCEPTRMELHNSTVSLLCFDLIIHGKAVHIAGRGQATYPQAANIACGESVGVDALKKALPFMEMFYRLEEEHNQRWAGRSAVGSGGHPRRDTQGVGVFNINPSFISGGDYIGSLPGCIKIRYAMWHPPEIPYEECLKEVRERVMALAQSDGWLKEHPPEVIGPVDQLWPGFVTDVEIPPVRSFRKAYEDALGYDPVISGNRATCDGSFLKDFDIPSILCGPGQFADGAHGYNEFVPRKEVLDAAKVYAAMILKWCR